LWPEAFKASTADAENVLLCRELHDGFPALCGDAVGFQIAAETENDSVS
jgi:hypothetical protein